MRFFISIMFSSIFFVACNTKDTKAGNNKTAKEQNAILRDSANFTTIEWLDSTSKNFGKIPEGQKLDVAFHFKNSGTKPLIITRVQPSCGCTIAEQPQEPIAPGAEGVIRASFNSEGRTGVNHKTLFVFANTKGTQESQVQFTVEVDKKKF
ncbi:MAG: DUF1573 domain-containing protein [Bacteroidetes bacterium]|nr:DUF1573 domain-containing protein [Bacteroidota bacterium]MBS1934272.1 DUF1573 domain-containing protein [Bacteroidota bacterium]